MTPEALAALHARCFIVPRPFTADEFRDYLASDICFLVDRPGGFALGRAVADEAELLTLAVDPEKRRRGVGRALLDIFETEARRRGAGQAYLEVAAGNAAARGLYRTCGWRESGLRRAYYRNSGRTAEDAVVMVKALSAA